MSGYTADIPHYYVNLDLPEKYRWSNVIEYEGGVAQELAEAACEEMEEVTDLIRSPVLKASFFALYRMFGGLYGGEIRAWAKTMGISSATAAVLNCTYELSHVAEGIMQPFGCTAGVRWLPNEKRMVHVRSMDWPLGEIGDATRRFIFHKGGHIFVSVGVPGFVGVLSGMVPGAYSVTINWAPPQGMPEFSFGPSFLLRHVMETCKTYDEAVEALCETELATTVFYTVCGTRKKEACVIERTPEEYLVREIGNQHCLVQANHHVGHDFLELNEVIKVDEGDGTIFEDSRCRASTMRKKLNRAKTITGAISALKSPPVENDFSYQQMIFCPAQSEMYTWRWASD